MANENKFSVVSQKLVETEAGEKLIYIVYNHVKEKVSYNGMRDALKKTLLSIPNDKEGKPFEYKITVLTSVGWRSGKGGWSIYNKNKPNEINFYNPEEEYELGEKKMEKLMLKMLKEALIAANQKVEDNTPPEKENSLVNYHSAVIVLRKQPKKAGGNDKNNDCLYYALKDSGNYIPWKFPQTFKKFLKLDRKDKVHIDLIPLIEKKLNLSINITGDINYNSGSQHSKTIHLKLIDGHYTLNRGKAGAFQLLKKALFKSQKPLEFMIYTSNKDMYEIMTETNKEIQTITKTTFYSMINDNKYCSYQVNTVDVETFEKIYKEIKDLENYGVNILNYTNIKNAVIGQIYFKTLRRFEVDPLEPLESQFLDKALSGGIIHRKPGTYKNVEYYDVNSQYPHILANTGLLFPTRKPEFKNLESLPANFISFGIYRAKITGDINPFLFRTKSTHYYTHYEINRARQLGYNVNLIIDGEANAMIYDAKARVPSKSVFKNYMNEFYEIKKETKSQVVKAFLNLVWGALTQRHKIFRNLSKSGHSNLHIQHIKTNNDDILVEQYKNDKLFKYPYARLGVFLTAYGRCHISKIIEPYKEYVRRVHTDGFLLEGNTKQIFTGSKMGELKLEYEAEEITI